MADEARHLDLYDLAAGDQFITLGVRISRIEKDQDNRERKILGPLERRTLRFKGSFPIPTVIRLLNYETRLKEAVAIVDEAASEKACESICISAYDEILNLAGSLNVIEEGLELELDTFGMLAVIAQLSGKNSMADAIMDMITAGKSIEEITAGLTAEGLAENAEAGGGAELGSGPLGSKTPSSTPS
jgi:hypothetical protein